jgi:hypothetical protein
MSASSDKSIDTIFAAEFGAASARADFDMHANKRVNDNDDPKPKTKKEAHAEAKEKAKAEADARRDRILSEARMAAKGMRGFKTGGAEAQALDDVLDCLASLTPDSACEFNGAVDALACLPDDALRDDLIWVAAYKSNRDEQKTHHRVKVEAKRLAKKREANSIHTADFQKVLKYNDHFAVVRVKKDAFILYVPPDLDENGNVKPVELIRESAFHTLHESDQLDGRSATQLWMHHKERKTYLNGLDFNPGKAPGGTSDGTFNLWRGLSVKPVKGDWSLMRQHIFKVICRENPLWFAFVMSWLADMVRNPANKPGTGVAVKGDMGCGKSIVTDYLRKLMKYNACSISRADQIIGRFNAHTATSVFTVVEEAIWAGNKEGEGVLKDMVTSPTMLLESKGVDAYEVRNYQHFWFNSNNDWFLPAGRGERRWLALLASDDKSDAKRKAAEESTGRRDPYFDNITHQMDNGGLEAMLFDLEHLHIPAFVNLRSPPRTPWLAEQVAHGLSVYEKWWLACLRNGAIDDSLDGSTEWKDDTPLSVSTTLTSNSLKAFAREMHTRVNEVQLGKFMHSEFVGATRKRGEGHQLSKHRPWHYEFPPLSELRKRFTATFNIPFDDPDPAKPDTEPEYSSWGLDAPGLQQHRTMLESWKAYGEGGCGEYEGVVLVPDRDTYTSPRPDPEPMQRPSRPPHRPKRLGKRI